MTVSKKINASALIAVLFVSSIAIALPENPEGLVKRVVKKDAAVEEVLPVIYAQAGVDSQGNEKLRFSTPVKVSDSTTLAYTRSVEGVDDKVVEVKSVYKAIEANEVAQYYDGTQIVSEDPQNDYYWANYLIEFNEDSAYKSKMFTITLDVDGKQAPFLTTSYNAVAQEGPVASFKDETGKLVGRSIVESGSIPVFAGEALEEGQSWFDGLNYYSELPAISTDTVFSVVDTPRFIEIDLSAPGFVTGYEKFGVYFYNTVTGANTWVQAVLQNTTAKVAVPEGMNGFKVLRTELNDQPLSWESPYWGASGEITLNDLTDEYKFTSFNDGNFVGDWVYPLPTKIEVNFYASGLITGGERFGIYFYNAETGANTWVQVLLSSLKGYSAYLDVPEGMNAFKVLRTSAVDAPITWESAWWGSSGEISLTHEATRYVFTSFGADGNMTGQWITEENPTMTIKFEAAGLVTGGERFGIYFYNKATNVNTWVQAEMNGSVGTVKVPYGMDSFKILRTSLGEEEISWNSPYWGGSNEITINVESYLFVCSSFDNGTISGSWVI